jgi:hypothetical protein
MLEFIYLDDERDAAQSLVEAWESAAKGRVRITLREPGDFESELDALSRPDGGHSGIVIDLRLGACRKTLLPT